MTVFERIKKLSDNQGKSMQTVAEEIGLSKNVFYKWKTSDPKGVDLQKVADYFGVSVDYLLGREETEKIKKADLSDDDVVFAFDGHEVTQEEKAMLKSMIEAYRKNKQ